jgi:hypothetical protein
MDCSGPAPVKVTEAGRCIEEVTISTSSGSNFSSVMAADDASSAGGM